MGLDFIRERAQGFIRSWDRHQVELATRSLFTRDPACLPRAAIATTLITQIIPPGTILIVRCEQGGLVAYDELTPVARFVDPPQEVVCAIRECGGCAKGEVTVVHDASLLEIAI
jgi:hypothetical protein